MASQDWWLVAAALAQFAGDPRECTAQENRALELDEDIAADQSLTPSAVIRQFEYCCSVS